MNVNLVYQQTGYSFQISQFTPLSVIYEVASKVFHIPGNNIKLFFKEQYVPNEQTYASNYFKKFPVIINILENKKTIQSNNNNEKAKIIEEKTFNETFSEKAKQKKKNFIKCQICNRKNSIFYCRNCNQFICFECNLRFPEHFSHKKISLESGDLLLCFEDYRNSVLEQLNELNNAFRFSSQNIYTDQKRSELFDNLINTLKDLDKKTQSLTIMGTSYKCSNEVLNSFNKELREIEAPKYKEETINSFGLVNEKELEIQNYISFINLQILKSKFNIKMTIFFNETKKIFDDLTIEINNKLKDSLNLKEKDYKDLVSYNKEKYKEKDSSTSRSHSLSSSRSSNHSLSLNSSTTKNIDDNNKLSDDKFSSSNNINNKIDLNPITNKYMKKNSKLIDNNKNENNSYKNLINYKNNHTEANLNRINSCSVVVKEENSENNESDDNNLITLPKIKIGNDPNYDININRKNIFKPIEKNKKNCIIHLKNVNNIKDSMQNILKKSLSQSKEVKQIEKRNNNLNNLKIFTNENPPNSKEIERPKILKTIQSNKNFDNSYKRAFSNIKIKSVHIKNDISPNPKLNENNKNRISTINNESIRNSLDKYETNRILNSLKKLKPKHKIKLYDTYKIKENEANNDNNDFENLDYNNVIIKLMKKKSQNEIKKKKNLSKRKINILFNLFPKINEYMVFLYIILIYISVVIIFLNFNNYFY